MPTWWVMDVHIYHQIFYALYSLRGIKENGEQENNIGIFFYIQALLLSLGNISKALKSLPEYVDYLGLDLSRIPSILDRSMRNTNEHFEERYWKALNQLGCVFDLATGHHDNTDAALLRYFNTASYTIEFVDSNFNLQKIRIGEIESELNYIKSTEPIDYIFQRYDGHDHIL